MNLIRLQAPDLEKAAPLTAAFRVTLQGFKGIASQPDLPSAREELEEYLARDYPIFAAESDGQLAGYTVLRIDDSTIWVEQLYVREEYRRQGVASLLFEKAEELAAGMGGDTLFNFVHPNNHRMIGFLRSKGYTVLNLLEIRKPFQGETLTTTIRVGDHTFEY